MKKFGNLVWRALLVFLPIVLLLMYLVTCDYSSMIAIAIGWVYGSNFEADWARFKLSYSEFRNRKDDSNDESS